MRPVDNDDVARFCAEIEEDESHGVIATIRLRWRANRGDVEAQYVIGRTLMYGSGVAKIDIPAARTWLTLAATAGHVRAAHYLEILNGDTSS